MVGPEAPAPEAATPEQVEPHRFDLALVRARGLGQRGLQSELALRIPELELRPHQEAGELSGRTAPYLYLEAQRRDGAVYRIAVIISDGRAYYDEVEVGDATSAERVVASTLANLIFSIEQGSVQPDREDAEIPPAEDPKPPEQTPEPAPTPPEETEPTEPAPPRPPRIEIGIAGSIATLLGHGPEHFADVYLGAGGSLGVELRTHKGAFAFVDFRPSGRREGDFRLLRLRSALGAGYAWRGQRIEIATALGLAVEPWLVTSASGVQPILGPNGSSARPPLLSAFLRMSPGYHIALQRGALQGIRIGPRIELGGGFVVADGVQMAGLQQDGRELFRLGGTELATGFEIVAWFGRSQTP
jgi:hypothetical protein